MYIVMVKNRSEYSGPQIGVATLVTCKDTDGTGEITFKTFSKLDAAEKYVSGDGDRTPASGSAAVVVIVSGPIDTIVLTHLHAQTNTSPLFWLRRDVCQAIEDIVADHVAGRLSRPWLATGE